MEFLKEWLENAINNYECFKIEVKGLNKPKDFEEYKVFNVKIHDYPTKLIKIDITIYINENKELFCEDNDRLTLDSIDEHWLWLQIVQNAYNNGLNKRVA